MSSKLRIPNTTRRLFLSRSVQALAAAASMPMLSACETLTTGGTALPPSQPGDFHVLSTEERLTLAAVADTVIPKSGGFALGAIDIGLANRISGHLSRFEPELIAGVKGSLQVVDQRAPLMIGEDRPFRELTAEQQDSAFTALKNDRDLGVRVFAALRGLCLFYFYTHADSWRHVGYEGTLV